MDVKTTTHVDVLLLRGEQHPHVGEEAGDEECRVHRPDHARQAALLDHPVRLPAPMRRVSWHHVPARAATKPTTHPTAAGCPCSPDAPLRLWPVLCSAHSSLVSRAVPVARHAASVRCTWRGPGSSHQVGSWIGAPSATSGGTKWRVSLQRAHRCCRLRRSGRSCLSRRGGPQRRPAQHDPCAASPVYLLLVLCAGLGQLHNGHAQMLLLNCALA